MSQPTDLESRVAALEARMEQVAGDAAAARHLAAAINALGVQTAARFDRLEQRVDAGFAGMRAKFDQVDNGFAEMRGRLDQTAAGLQQIVDLLSRPGDQ